jgi:hypothetical protein
VIRFLFLLLFYLAQDLCFSQILPTEELHDLEKRLVAGLKIDQQAVGQLLKNRAKASLSVDFLVYPPAQFGSDEEKGFISRVENLLSARMFTQKKLRYVRSQFESLDPVDLTLHLRFHLTDLKGGTCLQASAEAGDGELSFLDYSEICSDDKAFRETGSKAAEHLVDPDSSWQWFIVVLLLGGAGVGIVFRPGRGPVSQEPEDTNEELIADEVQRQVEIFKSLKHLQVFHRSQDTTTSKEEEIYAAIIAPHLALLNTNIPSLHKASESCFCVQGRNQQIKNFSLSCRDLISLLRSMQKSKEGITAPMKMAFLTVAPQSFHLNLSEVLRNLLNEPELSGFGIDKVVRQTQRDVLLRVQTASSESVLIKSYLEDLSEIFREWIGNAVNNAKKANGNSVNMELLMSEDEGLISLRFQNQGVACPQEFVELVNSGDSNALARKKGRETGYPELIDSIARLRDLENSILGGYKCRIFLQNLENGVESRLVWSKKASLEPNSPSVIPAPDPESRNNEPECNTPAANQPESLDPRIKHEDDESKRAILIIEDEFDEKFEILKSTLQDLSWVLVKSQQEALEILSQFTFKRIVLDANYLLRPGDEFAETEMEHLSVIVKEAGKANIFLYSSDLDIQERWSARCKDSGQRVNMSGKPEDLKRWLSEEKSS